MFTDDQPRICMESMGNPHIQTPNMDRLAADPQEETDQVVEEAYAAILGKLRQRCDEFRQTLR